MRIINLLKVHLVSLIAIVCLLASSCSKNSPENYVGLIRNSGEVSLDGCGWVVDIESITYHPTNLSSDFQQDSLNVTLSFKNIDGKFNCGFGSSLSQIEIIDIQK